LSVAKQVSILFAANEGYLDDVDNKNIQRFKKEWFEYYDANLAEMSQRLNAGEGLSDDDKKALKDALDTFKSSLFNA